MRFSNVLKGAVFAYGLMSNPTYSAQAGAMTLCQSDSSSKSNEVALNNMCFANSSADREWLSQRDLQNGDISYAYDTETKESIFNRMWTQLATFFDRKTADEITSNQEESIDLAKAVRSDDLQQIKDLFEQGFDVNSEDDRQSPVFGLFLSLSIHRENQEIIQLFLENGVDLKRVISWAIDNDQIDVFRQASILLGENPKLVDLKVEEFCLRKCIASALEYDWPSKFGGQILRPYVCHLCLQIV